MRSFIIQTAPAALAIATKTQLLTLNLLEMTINWFAVLASGVIPLLVGFVWYHPKVFGNAWMKLVNIDPEKAKQSNMALVFGLTLLLGIILATSMIYLTIHQSHMMSTLMNIPGFGQEGSEVDLYYKDFLSKYGQEFRSFRHGALHGIISGIFIAFPIIAVTSMFEQKSWKYIFINLGFWIVCMALMGGVVCAWA